MKGTPLIALLIVSAAAQSEGLNYDFIEAGWASTEIDTGITGNIDGDAVSLEGSFAFADRVHGFAAMSLGGFDFGVDVNTTLLGIGYNTPFTESIDFVASGAYIRTKFDGLVDEATESGFGVNLGVRGLASEQFEYSGFLNYADVTDGEFGVSFQGIFFPIQEFGIGASVSLGDDTTTFGISGRYYFKR